jgi:hypothetical protein
MRLASREITCPFLLRERTEHLPQQDAGHRSEVQGGSISGTKETMDRPAWRELMTALHSDGVRTTRARSSCGCAERACGNGLRSAAAKAARRSVNYEGETDVVARMQALRTEGLSFHRIAAKLNEEKIAPRSGGRWHGFAVQKILARTNT